MEPDPKYITRRYTTPRNPGAFSGLSGFLLNNRQYRDKEKVEKSLREIESYSLHKPTRKSKRRVVWCSYPDLIWAADLAFYTQYSRQNGSYKYLLVVVDCFSKYLMVEPIKNKTNKEVINAFKNIFKKNKRKCERLYTDMGTEFFGKETVGFLKKNNIHIYKVHTIIKSSLAERMVRRVKTVIERYFTQNNTKKYIDVLDDIVKGINSSYNRSIKMAPNDVTHKNESEVWKNLYDRVIRAKQKPAKFSIGQTVRISDKKLKLGTKGYSRNFSKELFRIREVRKTIPIHVYKLEDLQSVPLEGMFYDFELQLISE